MDAASANQDDSDNDTPPPLRDESDDESSDSDSDSDESDDESSDRDDEEPPPLLDESDDESSDRDDEEPPPLLDESSDSDSDQSDDEDCSKMPTHLFCQFKECLRHFILEDGDDVNMPFCQYNSTTYTSLCRKRPRTGSVRRQLSRQRRRGGGDDGIWEAVMQTVLAHEHEIHDHRDHMQRRDDSKEQITSVWQYTRHNFKLHYGITRGQFARIAEVLVKLPRRFTVRHKDKKVGITREHALMILWLRWRGKKGCGTTWGHMGQHFNERGNFLCAWYQDVLDILKRSEYTKTATHVDLRRVVSKLPEMMEGMHVAGSVIEGHCLNADGKVRPRLRRCACVNICVHDVSA